MVSGGTGMNSFWKNELVEIYKKKKNEIIEAASQNKQPNSYVADNLKRNMEEFMVLANKHGFIINEYDIVDKPVVDFSKSVDKSTEKK